jgi:DNA-binding transcriptional regulator YiaG
VVLCEALQMLKPCLTSSEGKHNNRMTKEQLNKLQAEKQLSDSKLAALIGVTRSTVWKWRTGRHPIPHIAEVAINGLH